MNRKSPNQLKHLADERGLTVNMLITQTLLAEQTIRGAAVALGVADNTIRHHMKRMGVELEVTQVARLRPINTNEGSTKSLVISSDNGQKVVVS